MKIFLLWRSVSDGGQTLEPERVSSHLQRLFSPLFATPPSARVLQNSVMSLVVLELPVRGWKLPFFQEDEQTWVQALDYPVDARARLVATGRSLDREAALPALCRELQSDPTPLLRELAPPFSLIWGSKRTGETFVQNDGLGQAQLFEFQDSRVWALTNKIAALKALGLRPELEPESWAVRCALGWFPLQLTGYQHTRFLEPATQLRLDSQGLTRSRHEVLADWVRPVGLSPDECLELARSSLLEQIKAAMPFWDKPAVGLSGGWDTRAVVSSLRLLGASFSPRVRGLPGRHDVVIASQLAEIAGFDLKLRSSAGLPPERADACRRCIERASLWQAGYMVTHKHKSFLSDKPYLDGGVVNVMGQHGEIGRGYYAKRIRAAELSEDRYEARLVGNFMAKMPGIIRESLHDAICQIILDAYRQADRYDLLGLARLDFFYLYERTRRWASGSLSAQSGLVLAPFLNPNYIRAVFGYLGQPKESNPFHRHIIAVNAPDWADVPYASDLKERERARRLADAVTELERAAIAPTGWRRPKGNKNYDDVLYWEEVGKPILEEALKQGGFWTEIFDPDVTRQQYLSAPDALAMVHVLPDVLRSC